MPVTFVSVFGAIFYHLFPSEVVVLHFEGNGTDGGEILLTDVAGGKTNHGRPLLSLLDFRHEVHRVHGISTSEANGEVVTVLSHLRKSWGCKDEREDE